MGIIEHTISSDYKIVAHNSNFINFFGPIVKRKCFEIFHQRLFPCEECPTFKVMKSGIPQMKHCIIENTHFKSIVKGSKDHLMVHEKLIPISSITKGIKKK